VDCDWTSWVPTECSKACDDTCPDPLNPYGCGGWQVLNRQMTVKPNECGFACPTPKRSRKCNQIKCPVDCVMSKWSGWSECSVQCGGGVQGRTRSILTSPKNGGLSCNTASETQPCKTGSCDRNCMLKRWTSWSPCSVACGGGFQERLRRVLRPTRGNGKCPKSESRFRKRWRGCNTHECTGDEICIAKQDLILSIDASGSLRAEGFKIIKDFAKVLVGKYKGVYFGFEDMRIGLVQFGNGEILADGTIQNAVMVKELTSDMEEVTTAIEGLTYLKGFTNMAQAFGVAERLLFLGSRRKAQSAVMTLSDGKPSFLFQTYEKVMQLKDKHVKLFFAPVTEFKGEEMQLMKKWASEPWYTHIVHIPGLAPLEADKEVFAQKCLVQFCPEAISPSAMFMEETEVGYMLVAENSFCEPKGQMLSEDVLGAADCAALAEGADATSFHLGIEWARGRCYAGTMQVDKAKLQAIMANRANPPCGGGWKKDALYDFYAIEPVGGI